MSTKRRLWILRVARQDAFKEAKFLRYFKVVETGITKYYPKEDKSMNRWLDVQFPGDLYESCHDVSRMNTRWILQESSISWRARVFAILSSSRGNRQPNQEHTNGFP